MPNIWYFLGSDKNLYSTFQGKIINHVTNNPTPSEEHDWHQLPNQTTHQDGAEHLIGAPTFGE